MEEQFVVVCDSNQASATYRRYPTRADAEERAILRAESRPTERFLVCRVLSVIESKVEAVVRPLDAEDDIDSDPNTGQHRMQETPKPDYTILSG